MSNENLQYKYELLREKAKQLLERCEREGICDDTVKQLFCESDDQKQIVSEETKKNRKAMNELKQALDMD